MAIKHGAGQASARGGEFVGTKEAAAELGVSEATMRRWLAEGRIAGRRVGKQWRIARSELGRAVRVPEVSEGELASVGSELLARLDRELSAALGEEDVPLPEELADWASPGAARLIRQAIREGVSDLHIEPGAETVKIRKRIDGLLHDVVTLSRESGKALVDRIKETSAMDATERSRPQFSVVRTQIGGETIDLHLATFPAWRGESLTIRLMHPSRIKLGLEHLGFEPDQLAAYRRIIHMPYGLVLGGGPAGCGKTTTVYSTLFELSGPGVKVMTAENPVEYDIEGMTQMQIDPAIGVGYSQAIYSMMRSAPNIMFVGELLDLQTAEQLVQAAMTGHMVFSLVHAGTTIGIIGRLIDLGLERRMIGSAVRGLFTQRLLRLICPECKVEYDPQDQELTALGLDPHDRSRTFWCGKGCAACNQTGYRGRTAVFEVLEMTDELREAIVAEASPSRLAEIAHAQGWRPLREVALAKLYGGETTLAEATCVAFDS